MKAKIFLIFIFFIQINFAQKITEEAKQAIIGYIDSTSYSIRLDAIMKIYDYGIVEAVPKLEANIFRQEQDIALLFFRYIVAINPEKTIELAHKFIDSVGYLRKGIKTTNEYKTEATYYLFRKGDYSTANIIFETIEEKKPNITSTAFVLLPDVIDNVPEYELQAKEELKRIMLNFNDDYYAPMAIVFLTNKYGEELIPDLENVIYNSTSGTIKNIAYDKLKERNYPDIESITKYLFLNEKELTRKWLNKILIDYNTPSNYKFLQENYQSILLPEWLPAYQEYFQQTKLSNPLYPPSFNNLFEQFDYFKDLCDSLVAYFWLGDLNFSNELKNILTTAKTNLQNGDSLTCAVKVKEFQDLVDNVYKDSLNLDPRFVTIEGWKFLYWNAQYILDRLPSFVTSDIEVINPAMSMVNPGSFTMEVKGTGFTTNSTVYFNGNARTTTFVADTLLTAEIQITDVSVAGNCPVWVSSGTTNSDTLIFSVVTALPKPVRPVLECVRNNGDGTYTAYFGYKNENSVSVYIPVGSKNKFTPTPQDRGQTTVFLPGRNYRVFTVNFNGSNLVWTLNGRTSTASSNSAPCN